FPARIGLMTSLYTTIMGLCASLASGFSVPIAHSLGLGWEKGLMFWAILTFTAIILWLPQLWVRDNYVRKEVQTANDNLWHSPLAWKVTCFMGLQSFSFYVTITWLPEILHDNGMSVILSG